MARQRRKSRKGRRNKTIRQQGSGENSRSALALSLDDANFTYQSDKVYSGGNDPITRMSGWDSARDYAVEFELSDHYIVWTVESRPLDASQLNTHIRIVFAGDFSYGRDGILSGGTIYNAGIDNTDSSDNNNSRRFYGQTYVAPAAGVKIGSPRTIAGWMSTVNEALAERYLMDDYLDHEFGNEQPTYQPADEKAYFARVQSEGRQFYFAQIGRGLDAVRAFGQGRFFNDYWWNNPFSSNLV